MSTTEIHYPPELPVSERRQEILDTIAENQVVVIAGETGSGKSTQIPKLCLELGRGTDKWIGHTQPRRIAARSIAERVASELNEQVGDRVGYAVRFQDKVSAKTQVKLMTDGILLAEIQRDRTLGRYDTIIIDEAHERSLNIDFLLGYLKQLLPRRPDLKIIITSATIDTEKFSKHFDDAPVIEVTGRTYPVEQRYRPLDKDLDNPLDQAEGIAEAVRELWHASDGDVLVFCSGEREIRDAEEAVNDLGLRGLETLPLYARLSASEQHRVFDSHKNRRVVIATNVAETSLTVPGIRSVVDTGLARVSRYSNRTKVQRLPIEPISQASADQRAGRCGRIGPGICIRLYSEDDYNARDEFTDPEIQRTNLASVILQMASLGLGQIDRFPFVEPPDHRNIRDGIALLEELDAVDPEREGQRDWLTGLGRQLARLPIDPRLGRMIIEADHNGCLREVLIIASALSIQDPRERPSDKREAADESHRRFNHPGSDFLALVNLWEYVREEQRKRSSGSFRRMCRSEFIHHQRVREWQDLERQLRRVARDMKFRTNDTPADASAVHQALLSGLLSQIGMRDTKQPRSGPREFIGPRNGRFVITRGSALTKVGAPWVMAGELVETNRVWARVVAGIDPAWLEDLADHLVKRTYTDPRWDPSRGMPVVTERVHLWGLPVVGGRTIGLGRINPELARDLFIHHGLIEREFEDGHRFLEHGFLAQNDAALAAVEEFKARSRDQGLEDERGALTQFYEKRIGTSVVSAGHFNRWWKKRRAKDPSALDLSPADILGREALVDELSFPITWLGFDVTYQFDASSPIDGIVVDIPLPLLAATNDDALSWHVPGFRTELVEQLIRTLPKETRKNFVPVPETARRIVGDLVESEASLPAELARALSNSTGVTVAPAMFDPKRLDKHLRPTFRIIGPDGATLAASKDLDSLRRRLEGSLHQTLADTFASHRRPGATTWEFGSISQQVEADGLVGFPALVDRGDQVGVDVFASADEQQHSMWEGTRRLIRFQLRQPARTLDRQLPDRVKLALTAAPVQSRVEWYNDAIGAAIDDLLARRGGPVWNADAFVDLANNIRADIGPDLAAAATTLAEVVLSYQRIDSLLDQRSAAFPQSVTDARNHLARLVYPGVMTGVGSGRHSDLIRYLAAIERRLEVLSDGPGRDGDNMAAVRSVESEFAALAARARDDASIAATSVEDVGFMIEEYRVSLFAPSVGAAVKVSAKRIRSAIAEALI